MLNSAGTISMCTLYNPVLQDEGLQVTISYYRRVF